MTSLPLPNRCDCPCGGESGCRDCFGTGVIHYYKASRAPELAAYLQDRLNRRAPQSEVLNKTHFNAIPIPPRPRRKDP